MGRNDIAVLALHRGIVTRDRGITIPRRIRVTPRYRYSRPRHLYTTAKEYISVTSRDRMESRESRCIAMIKWYRDVSRWDKTVPRCTATQLLRT